MNYDNHYDAAEAAWHEEEMRERRQEYREEEEIERWKMARFESHEMQSRSILADDDCGYDMDDPKHPTWHQRQLDHADIIGERA